MGNDSCIFCAIAAGDAPAHRLHEDERTVAFMDIQPAADGHALVIPRRHARDLLDTPTDDLDAMVRVAQQVARAAVEALDADGVNLLQATGAAAFQTVFHVHLHVIPRYTGDGIQPPWIPSPGRQDAIEDAAERIRVRMAA